MKFSEDLIRQTHDTPGAVLALAISGPEHGFFTFVATITTVPDLNDRLIPLYRLGMSEPDDNDLCHETRQYYTTDFIRSERARKNGPDWYGLSHRASIDAMVVEERWLSGADAIVAEVAQDPTAWTKYVI